MMNCCFQSDYETTEDVKHSELTIDHALLPPHNTPKQHENKPNFARWLKRQRLQWKHCYMNKNNKKKRPQMNQT